jgi:hypothetical protein
MWSTGAWQVGRHGELLRADLVPDNLESAPEHFVHRCLLHCQLQLFLDMLQRMYEL